MKQLMYRLLLALLIVSFHTRVSADSFRDLALNKDIDRPGPLKGIVLWPNNDKIEAYKESIALEFSYCLPCQVVTGKDDEGAIQYDWTSFEAMLNEIAGRDHQAIVRFRYEYPGEKIAKNTPGCTCDVKGATAVPAYIKEMDDYKETYESNPGGDGNTYYADWSHAELQRFTKQFYRDFAEKYDSDPRIAFLQVGFGHWSEYHIYGTSLKLGTNFPSKTYQSEFLQVMDEAFEKTPWSISIDAADSDYTPIVGDKALESFGFGLFDDSFMHKDHGDYNAWCWSQLGAERWKTSPGGGEISYYEYPYDQYNFLNPGGMYGRTWEQQVAQYHITYMIANDAVDGQYATTDRVREASIASGYQFEVTKYQVSDRQARVAVKNIGVAPIYHDAYITVKGERSTLSLKGLQPGEEQKYTVDLLIEAGETPELTITSDKLLEGQTIPYRAQLDSGGTSIGSISPSPRIKQCGSYLYFSGENYRVNIYNLQGIIVFSTRADRFDFSTCPAGCYIVQYFCEDGEAEVVKFANPKI